MTSPASELSTTIASLFRPFAKPVPPLPHHAPTEPARRQSAAALVRFHRVFHMQLAWGAEGHATCSALERRGREARHGAKKKRTRRRGPRGTARTFRRGAYSADRVLASKAGHYRNTWTDGRFASANLKRNLAGSRDPHAGFHWKKP